MATLPPITRLGQNTHPERDTREPGEGLLAGRELNVLGSPGCLAWPCCGESRLPPFVPAQRHH